MMMIFYWVAWLDWTGIRPKQRSEFRNYCNPLAPSALFSASSNSQQQKMKVFLLARFPPVNLRGWFSSHWADQLSNVSSQWTHHHLRSMSRNPYMDAATNLGHVDFGFKEHLHHHLSLYAFTNLLAKEIISPTTTMGILCIQNSNVKIKASKHTINSRL